MGRWLRLAELIDAWRVFPRLFFGAYIAFFMYTTHWYTTLQDPTPEQTTFIGIFTGVGTAWFGLYLGSGRKWDAKGQSR